MLYVIHSQQIPPFAAAAAVVVDSSLSSFVVSTAEPGVVEAVALTVTEPDIPASEAGAGDDVGSMLPHQNPFDGSYSVMSEY